MNKITAIPVNPKTSPKPYIFSNHLKTWLFFYVFFCLTTSFAFAAESFQTKTYELPIFEVEKVITTWLRKDGFLLEQSSNRGLIIINGKKSNEEWQIHLTQDSSLATKISLQHKNDSSILSPNPAWDRLNGYLAPPPLPIGNGEHSIVKDKDIPSHILNLLDAIVCIRANHQNEISQFTGFFVDENGLILTTAHGLKEKQIVHVMLYDGTETEANVLLKNTSADLAVLRIPIQSGNFISLDKGRNLLSIGEEIFTMGCPLDLQGTIFSGRVNGPPRRMEGLPYWQVDMIVFQGSSGSPVFGANGNFVAMVKGKFRGTESIGFLIPLQTIMEFLQGSL